VTLVADDFLLVELSRGAAVTWRTLGDARDALMRGPVGVLVFDLFY
jgi:hypothetical protein